MRHDIGDPIPPLQQFRLPERRELSWREAPGVQCRPEPITRPGKVMPHRARVQSRINPAKQHSQPRRKQVRHILPIRRRQLFPRRPPCLPVIALPSHSHARMIAPRSWMDRPRLCLRNGHPHDGLESAQMQEASARAGSVDPLSRCAAADEPIPDRLRWAGKGTSAALPLLDVSSNTFSSRRLASVPFPAHRGGADFSDRA